MAQRTPDQTPSDQVFLHLPQTPPKAWVDRAKDVMERKTPSGAFPALRPTTEETDSIVAAAAQEQAAILAALDQYRISMPASFAALPLHLTSADMTDPAALARIAPEERAARVQERSRVYAEYCTAVEQVLSQLAGLPDHLDALERTEQLIGTPDSLAGQFLHDAGIWRLYASGLSIGRNILLPAAERHGWEPEAATIRMAIDRLDTQFRALFDIQLDLRSALPRSQQELLEQRGRDVIGAIAEYIPPRHRLVPMTHMTDALSKSAHLQEEGLEAHVENVGRTTAALAREFICRIAIERPEDAKRLFVFWNERAGALPLDTIFQELEALHGEYLRVRAERSARLNLDHAEWSIREEHARSAALRKFYAAVLLAPEGRDAKALDTLRTTLLDPQTKKPSSPAGPMQREGLPRAYPGHTIVAKILEEKLDEKEDDLALYEEKIRDPQTSIQAYDGYRARILRLRKDRTELRSLLSHIDGLPEMPLLIEDALQHLEDGQELDPSVVHHLRGICPQLLHADESLHRTSRILDDLASQDPARQAHAADAVRQRAVELLDEELLGMSTETPSKTSPSFTHRAWSVFEHTFALHPVLAQIELGARHHDIGKLIIDAEALVSTKKLTEDEERQMRDHTRAGWYILRDLHVQFIRDMPRFHHQRFERTPREWYRSTRYPGSLSGQAIPAPARLLNISDSIRAVIETTRAYRKDQRHEGPAMRRDRAIAELDLCARPEETRDHAYGKGVQFDPAMAKLQAKLLSRAKDPSMDEAPTLPTYTEHLTAAHDLTEVLQTLVNALLVRNPDGAFHAIAATETLLRTFRTLPPTSAVWSRIISEVREACPELAPVPSTATLADIDALPPEQRLTWMENIREWMAGTLISTLTSDFGYITMSQREAATRLSPLARGKYQRRHRMAIMGTDELYSQLGDFPWVAHARLANLCHHGHERQGSVQHGGYIPNAGEARQLLTRDRTKPVFTTVAQRVLKPAAHERDTQKPLQKSVAGMFQQAVGALTHRWSKNGFPVDLAIARLTLDEHLYMFHESGQRYDMEILTAIEQSIRTQRETTETLELLIPPAVAPPKRHHFPLATHMHTVAALARPDALRKEHVQKLNRLEETGALFPVVKKGLLDALARTIEAMEASAEFRRLIHAAAGLHDIGKVSTRTITYNADRNRERAQNGLSQQLALRHAADGATVLDDIANAGVVDRSMFTVLSPRFDAQGNRDLPLVGEQFLEAYLQGVERSFLRESSEPARAYLRELVRYHLLPLSILRHIRADAAELISAQLHPNDPRRGARIELGRYPIAELLVRILASGMTSVPQEALGKHVAPSTVDAINTLLKQLCSYIRHNAHALALCEHAFRAQGQIRSQLLEQARGTSVRDETHVDRLFATPFLDAFRVVCLSDTFGKEAGLSDPGDAGCIVSVTELLARRATELLPEIASSTSLVVDPNRLCDDTHA